MLTFRHQRLPLWLFSFIPWHIVTVTAWQNSNAVIEIMQARYCTSLQFSALAIITVVLGLSSSSLILTFHITLFINLALHRAGDAVWTWQAQGDAEAKLLMKRARFLPGKWTPAKTVNYFEVCVRGSIKQQQMSVLYSYVPKCLNSNPPQNFYTFLSTLHKHYASSAWQGTTAACKFTVSRPIS